MTLGDNGRGAGRAGPERYNSANRGQNKGDEQYVADAVCIDTQVCALTLFCIAHFAHLAFTLLIPQSAAPDNDIGAPLTRQQTGTRNAVWLAGVPAGLLQLQKPRGVREVVRNMICRCNRRC